MSLRATQKVIYHICPEKVWREAKMIGFYLGPKDTSEKFIHFSPFSEIVESASKYYMGLDNLVLLWVKEKNIYPGILQWEMSRNEKQFPHIYGSISINCVFRVDLLTLDKHCKHIFPSDMMDMVEVA